MKTTYVIVKIRPEKKNSGSYGIRTQETRVLRKHEEGDQWIECINVEKMEGMKIFIYQNFNI